MKKKTQRTYIGGQAVIQGVMMRGKSGMATVVRDDKGEIHMEAKRIASPEKRRKWSRIPFVRGIISFVLSLVDGMKALLRSSEVAVSEDDQSGSKFSAWIEEKWKVSASDIVTFIATLFGIVIAIGLFAFLPNYLTKLVDEAVRRGANGELNDLKNWGQGGIYYNLIEGGFRLVIFIFYILFTLLFKSLRETYRYHGAEHKTINCYEYGLPLTKENVKSCSRLHDRCGTTFIFIVLLISILMFALAGYLVVGLAGMTTGNSTLDVLIMVLIKFACLPIVAAVSYEILKLLSLSNSPLLLPLKAPGYLMQMLTTREPSDDMIECAIEAFEKVLEMDRDPESPEKTFATEEKLSKLLAMMKKGFAEREIDETDAEWILALTLNIPRSSLSEERIVKQEYCKRILDIYESRLTGRPLWYIFGDTQFYGYRIKVDERVLIPRPETEILVREAVASLREGDAILDLCTGSGAIAIAIAGEGAKGKMVSVTATDISEEALEVARSNARLNKASINFIKTDLFNGLRGRYNLITANPPYIKREEISSLQREVRDFEPRIALDGGVDGLDFYRRIAQKVSRYIARGGMLILECGENQAQEIIKIFTSVSRCDYAMVVRDLAGVERVIKIGF
ncbi:MAG: peptide chain release factor N(5)-glutamine methyltransferase [Clostridia bacterium]|nr:peptide chain release factor N(5)-glutamine methyltransferase [Clostridia bacterium]